MYTYPNLFLELGISQNEIDRKIDQTFETMFFDPEERIYFEMGENMGYMLDTGNNDARKENIEWSGSKISGSCLFVRVNVDTMIIVFTFLAYLCWREDISYIN